MKLINAYMLDNNGVKIIAGSETNPQIKYTFIVRKNGTVLRFRNNVKKSCFIPQVEDYLWNVFFEFCKEYQKEMDNLYDEVYDNDNYAYEYTQEELYRMLV